MAVMARFSRVLGAAAATLVALSTPSCSSVISPQVDGEIAELHAKGEECWGRIANLTSQLQAVGAMAGGTGPALGPKLSPNVPGDAGIAAAPDVAPGGASGQNNKVPAETLVELRKLQTEFSGLQETAFKIGRESRDNMELQKHPDMNNYIQSLRTVVPRLQSLISSLEREYQRITGKKVERPKKKSKSRKIRGLSEEDIRSKARASVERDDRPFRTKAMDLVSTFRERQLQMQDKQRDLKLTMDGPDWPKEDWPLTTADAKNVGEAENMISASLNALNQLLEPLGGLGRAHESTDPSVLEQLTALSEMMSGYCEIIDRHVETVKRTHRAKKKKPRAAAQEQAGSLRDRLLNFGGASVGGQRPFAWLHGETAAEGPGLGASTGSENTFGSFAQGGASGLTGTASGGFGASPGGQGALGGFAQGGASGLAGGSGFGASPGGHGGLGSFAQGRSGLMGVAGSGLGVPVGSASPLGGSAQSSGAFGGSWGGIRGGLMGAASSGWDTPGGGQSAFGGFAQGGGTFGAQHVPPQPRAWSVPAREL